MGPISQAPAGVSHCSQQRPYAGNRQELRLANACAVHWNRWVVHGDHTILEGQLVQARRGNSERWPRWIQAQIALFASCCSVTVTVASDRNVLKYLKQRTIYTSWP